MPPDLVRVRLLQAQRLFYAGSEVLVTRDVAEAWCAPGRGTAEYVDPPQSPPKKRGRPKKQEANEEPPPAPLGLSTQDFA